MSNRLIKPVEHRIRQLNSAIVNYKKVLEELKNWNDAELENENNDEATDLLAWLESLDENNDEIIAILKELL